MQRYTWSAPAYDLLSLEWPIYRRPRLRAIDDLDLRPGDRVLDVGCGTGLNLPLLRERVGAEGEVTGVDLSAQMLEVAGRRVEKHGWRNVRLVRADGADLTAVLGAGKPFDAALATYALSLMDGWESAWDGMLALTRPGGRVAVVDLHVPEQAAPPMRWFARTTSRLGGSTPSRDTWRRAEADLADVVGHDLWSGHVRVRTGVRR